MMDLGGVSTPAKGPLQSTRLLPEKMENLRHPLPRPPMSNMGTIAAEPVPAPGNDRLRASQSLFKEGRSDFQSNRNPLRLIVFSPVATTVTMLPGHAR